MCVRNRSGSASGSALFASPFFIGPSFDISLLSIGSDDQGHCNHEYQYCVLKCLAI